jgi:hypothetical protein
MPSLCTRSTLHRNTIHKNIHMSRTYTTTKPMHRFCNNFDTTYRLSFLFKHITPKPPYLLCVQRYCVVHTSTDRTHTAKRDTKATRIQKTFIFRANRLSSMLSFLTLFHITFAINRVIMVNWFEPNPKLPTFFYLAGGRYLFECLFLVFLWILILTLVFHMLTLSSTLESMRL